MNSCGNGPARTKVLTLNIPTTPAAITGQSTGLCGATNITYTTAGSPNATGYNWTVPAGVTIVSGQGTSSITVNVAGGFTTGSIAVVGTNACGSGSTRSLTIIGAPGTPSPITGPVNVCPGATNITYAVNTVAGASSYFWTVPAGATIVSGQGTKSITVNWGLTAASNQTITVRASNACGNSGLRQLNGISINSIYCAPRLADDVQMLSAMNLFPNPATDLVNIQFITAAEMEFSIRILDVSGRLIALEQGQAVAGQNARQVAIDHLQSGIYFVVIEAGEESQMKRLIVE
jgi:hypothetical protein